MEHTAQPKKRAAYTHVDKVLMAFASLLYLAVVAFLSIQTNQVFAVILGTSPTLAYLIINFSFLKTMEEKHLMVWLLPMPLVVVFALVFSMNLPLLNGVDWQTLTGVNLVMSYVFAALIVFIGSPHKPRRTMPARPSSALSPNKPVITQKTFGENLKSIEDKCKAINFVIGRVYSDKKGGSKQLREKIKFDRKWYNTFTEITKEFSSERKKELVGVLHNILERLKVLRKKENEVFRLEAKPFITLQRDKTGNDTILEVLKKNDTDPVMTYYNSALEVGEAVLRYLEKK